MSVVGLVGRATWAPEPQRPCVLCASAAPAWASWQAARGSWHDILGTPAEPQGLIGTFNYWPVCRHQTPRPEMWGSSEQRPHGGSLILAHQVPEREDRCPRALAALVTDPRGSEPSVLLSPPPQHHCQLLWKFWSGWKLAPGLDRCPPGAGSGGPHHSVWRTLEGRIWIFPSLPVGQGVRGRPWQVQVLSNRCVQRAPPQVPPGLQAQGPAQAVPLHRHQLQGLLMNKPTAPGGACRLPVEPPCCGHSLGRDDAQPKEMSAQ